MYVYLFFTEPALIYNSLINGCFLCKSFLDIVLPNGHCCKAPELVNWTFFTLAISCCVVDGVIAPELTGVFVGGGGAQVRYELACI